MRSILRKIFSGQAVSFAQNGEDILISSLLRNVKNGFYVDVGANDPVRYSNTFALYRRGWSGINVDAMPGSMAPFKAKRRRDINLEAAISSDEKDLTFYIFAKSQLNTFSRELADAYEKEGYKPVEKRTLRTQRLSTILDEHIPPGRAIDLMSIDVEGFDYDALASNDWDKYRPALVVIEDLGFDPEDPQASKIFQFMRRTGYALVSSINRSLFFSLTK